MRPFDDFLAMRCYGELWTRPGLSSRDRSLVSIGVVAAQGRIEELRIHVRAALSGSVTILEIQEVLLQAGAHADRATVRRSFEVLRAVVDEPVRRFPARRAPIAG